MRFNLTALVPINYWSLYKTLVFGLESKKSLKNQALFNLYELVRSKFIEYIEFIRDNYCTVFNFQHNEHYILLHHGY